jgi:TonB family protein
MRLIFRAVVAATITSLAVGQLPDTATVESLTKQGVAQEHQGNFIEAEKLYTSALAAAENSPGPERLHLALALEHQARLLEKMQREEQAAVLAYQASEIRARHIEKLSEEADRNHLAGRGGSARQTYAGLDLPRTVRAVDPEYSPEAREARQQGPVHFEVDIWPDGRAHNFRLMKSLGFGLDEKAWEAVQSWRFRPALDNGRPATMPLKITVHFRLP